MPTTMLLMASVTVTTVLVVLAITTITVVPVKVCVDSNDTHSNQRSTDDQDDLYADNGASAVLYVSIWLQLVISDLGLRCMV